MQSGWKGTKERRPPSWHDLGGFDSAQGSQTHETLRKEMLPRHEVQGSRNARKKMLLSSLCQRGLLQVKTSPTNDILQDTNVGFREAREYA